MHLDKSLQYVFRIGSDNQHRIHWTGSLWHYEFLAGGVVFDNLKFESETELENELFVHGLTLERFEVDNTGHSSSYSQEIQQKIAKLEALGLDPCNKHGLTAKNIDNTCEACQNTDYPDDFKGQEG